MGWDGMGLQCWIHSPDDWVNSRKLGGGLLTVPLNKVLCKKITVGKLLVNKHLIIILYRLIITCISTS